MKKYFKHIVKGLLLCIMISSLEANQNHDTVVSKSKTLIYSYDKNSINPYTVTLKAKNSSCSVKFSLTHVTPYNTNCIEEKNSKNNIILCTKDKKLCKTIAEITYFKVTQRELRGKRGKEIPFVGGGEFNFLGGSGTRRTVEIFSNKKVVYKLYGISSSGITWQGKYSSTKNPYWVEKDVICYYDTNSRQIGICTNLYLSK